MAGAGLCDKLAEVQFLYSHGCPWSNGQLEVAAKSGYFELLRWCYEHGCRLEEASKVPVHAAASGNVELMAWVLQQPDTTLSEDAMSTAAAKGHTAMCALLREQQCPWDIRSPQVAATGRHLDCLRWLLDNGCPWDDHMRQYAAQGGSVEVLAYLQQQGMLSRRGMLTSMLNIAGRFDSLEAAKW
jgi:hypothetical protein